MVDLIPHVYNTERILFAPSRKTAKPQSADQPANSRRTAEGRRRSKPNSSKVFCGSMTHYWQVRRDFARLAELHDQA